MSDLDQRLRRVVGSVLGVTPGDVTDECSPDTVEAWTSLTHLNLILALESEFGISISPEESLDLISVKIIRMYLDEQGIGA